MKTATLFLASLALAGAAHAGLEIPANGSVQSGIGLVSGWHCDASQVEVLIDGFPALAAATRLPRGDTQGVCGRTDTGFALLFNYNALSLGRHVITVLADKRFVGGGEFRVAHAGSEFMTGKRASVVVRHFPAFGDTTTLAWDEEKQNFSIVDVAKAQQEVPVGAYFGGTYYGAALDVVNSAFRCGPVPPNPVRAAFPGTFVVTMGATITVEARLADGRSCTAAGPITDRYSGMAWIAWSDGPGVVSATLASSCREFDRMSVALDGERLHGSGTEDCATYTIRATR